MSVQTKPRVAILMGSKSDSEQLKPCAETLKLFGVPFVARVLSAHRTPNETVAFVAGAEKAGIEVVIAAAGGAAHLAGVCAAHTNLPVIGIPIESKSLKGLDSLLSTVQMPPGIPVATMGIGSQGAKNAAIFAVKILAAKDRVLKRKLEAERERMRQDVLKSSPEF